MILAATSVWVDHFRSSITQFVVALNSGVVAIHPFVIGELACGSLSGRERVLRDLANLPRVAVASDRDVLTLIEKHNLICRGVGLIDMHLPASTLITPDTHLWTHDRRLARLAGEFSIAYRPVAADEAGHCRRTHA